MGKGAKGAKRQKTHGPPQKTTEPAQKATTKTSSTTPASHKKPPTQTQHSEPTIPFEPLDRILLIGDGDLSFALSLVREHGAADLLATTYDSEAELLEKYPQAAEHKREITDEYEQRVLHGVDATKLGQKEVRKGRKWDRIVFNFPHVGGKSTDVNRQVRYNQEMLVSFFKAATPLLSPDGTIIITLFEGEPYTLWNIRDLARHSGLEVQRSFKFQAEAYPGYSHARTLGNIEGGRGWKGENRAAKSYVFQLKAGHVAAPKSEKKRKREGNASSDED